MNKLHIFLLLVFIFINTTEAEDPTASYCNGNSKTNNQISRNINTLLSQLVSGTIQNGFIITSSGSGQDQVFGLAQCRGDVPKTDCATCIRDAAKQILSLCPNQADARIWYDYCFLRYNTQEFFGEVDTSGVYLYNVENVTDPDVFNKELAALMKKISSEAVKPENKGLGKDKKKNSPFLTLYTLVQCTRDLSQLKCAECLATGIGNFPTVCQDKRGCRVLYSSCYIRYELYPFYFPLDTQESLNHASVKYNSVMAFNN